MPLPQALLPSECGSRVGHQINQITDEYLINKFRGSSTICVQEFSSQHLSSFFGQEFLLALAQGYRTTSVAGDKTAQAARRRLLRYHVIEETESGDRFEVPLIERWVKEWAV